MNVYNRVFEKQEPKTYDALTSQFYSIRDSSGTLISLQKDAWDVKDKRPGAISRYHFVNDRDREVCTKRGKSSEVFSAFILLTFISARDRWVWGLPDVSIIGQVADAPTAEDCQIRCEKCNACVPVFSSELEDGKFEEQGGKGGFRPRWWCRKCVTTYGMCVLQGRCICGINCLKGTINQSLRRVRLGKAQAIDCKY